MTKSLGMIQKRRVIIMPGHHNQMWEISCPETGEILMSKCLFTLLRYIANDLANRSQPKTRLAPVEWKITPR